LLFLFTPPTQFSLLCSLRILLFGVSINGKDPIHFNDGDLLVDFDLFVLTLLDISVSLHDDVSLSWFIVGEGKFC
jgi:hypothetical protein